MQPDRDADPMRSLWWLYGDPRWAREHPCRARL